MTGDKNNGLNSGYSLVVFTASEILVEEVLLDWLDFLSPKPDEVLVGVGYEGKIPEFWSDLRSKGKVSEIIGFPLNGAHPKDICIASLISIIEKAKNEWVLSVNFDTLPYRKGSENWLDEMFDIIKEDTRIIGATGSLSSVFSKEYRKGYYATKKFSANFGLIRKELWLKAIEIVLQLAKLDNKEFDKASIYKDNRFVMEYALESYMFLSGKRCIVREEDSDWSVFHVNQWEEDLRPIREDYRSRKKIEGYLNTGRPTKLLPWQIPPHKRYYGTKPPAFPQRVMSLLYGTKRIFKR